MTNKDYFFYSPTIMRVNAASEEEAHAQLNELVQAQVNDLEWERSPVDFIPNPALAALQYALNGENHQHNTVLQMHFLELWDEGDFDALRTQWDDVPDDVFIGADSEFNPAGED